MKPKVSVVIPAYNGAEFVEETVRAVVGQTFSDWELLVVNNASTDGTGEILERLRGELEDPRIRIITHSTTLPPCENWNNALGQVRGIFVKLICVDDIPAPDSLARQVAVFEKYPSVVLATGASSIIDGAGVVQFTRKRIRKAGVYGGKEIIRRCILAGTNIIGDPVHVMWRKSAMDQVGMFDPGTPYASDVEYWFRLLTVGDLFCDEAVTGQYRVHKGAESTGRWLATTGGFLQIAKMQLDRGHVKISPLHMACVRAKANMLGIAREMVYRLLG